MTGRIVKSTGSWYLVLNEKNEVLQARLRGKFRLDNIKHTNPVAVGDEVTYDVDSDGLAVITKIHERKNYIIRRSVNLSKKTHIIASNIDVAYLMVSLSNPKTSFGFIDRFLITAEAYHIPVVILFNKIDTYNDEELEMAEEYKNIYEAIGYECIEISALEGTNIGLLKDRLNEKISLFSGHSGVGKSTLINTLNPGLDLKTSEISTFNQKGQHTTTFAQMYAWPFGGFLIDTPGIKEFGLVDIQKDELQGYFPEILEIKQECKYDNCLHINEPKCAVIEAVETGEIAASRYDNYVKFLMEEIM